MSFLKVGACFQFQDRANDDHLYIVISDPQQSEVVLVGVTTKRRFADTACELSVGDHPFIQHDSCISYDYAEIISVAAIEAKLAVGDIRPREDFGKAIVRRIWEGAERTRNLSNRCTEMLRQQSLIS